jgi:hypothetical protein
MDESPRPRASRPIWPLMALLAVILVMGVVLTQVDLSKLISPLLAGKRPGTPDHSAVIGLMVVVLIGVPTLALGLLVRATYKRARSSPVRDDGETPPKPAGPS